MELIENEYTKNRMLVNSGPVHKALTQGLWKEFLYIIIIIVL